jgi:hypothetical protein
VVKDPSSVVTWDPDGTALLEVEGENIEEALTQILGEVLTVARGEPPASPASSDAAETIAAPIRGQGADYSTMLDELVGDLLNQLDVHGRGLHRVRLDGMLEGDDGEYSAWGYLLGVPDEAPPAVSVAVDERPIVARVGDTIKILLRLRAV